MATTNKNSTTRRGRPAGTAKPKAASGTPETLPPLTQADGSLASNTLAQTFGQYRTIELFNEKETVLIHSDSPDAPTVRVGKAVLTLICALVLAGTAGRSMQTDGALMWLGSEPVQKSRNLKAFRAGWSVRMIPSGNGGADRYEAPVETMNQIGVLRAGFVADSVKRWPARRSVRNATEKKQEEVDRLFFA